MPEYTVAAAAAVLVVVALELVVFRAGIFKKPAYWVCMAIVLGFQVIVDGWLTKLSAPIVIYAAKESSGVRFPWDIPIEDFAYGSALVTIVLILWDRLEARGAARSVPPSSPSPAEAPSPES